MIIEPNHEIIKKQFIIDSVEDSHIIRLNQQTFVDYLYRADEEYSFELMSLQAYDSKNHSIECISTLLEDVRAIQVMTDENTEYPVAIAAEVRIVLPYGASFDNYTSYFENVLSAYYCRSYDMKTGKEILRMNTDEVNLLPGEKDMNNGIAIGNCLYFTRELHDYKPEYYYESTWYKYSKTNDSCTEIPEFKNVIFLTLVNASDNFLRLYGIFVEGKGTYNKAILRQAYIYASVDSDGNIENITIIKDSNTYLSKNSFYSALSMTFSYQDDNELVFYTYYVGAIRINRKEDAFKEIDTTKSFIYHSSFYKTEKDNFENIYMNIVNSMLNIEFYTGATKETITLDPPKGYIYNISFTKPYMFYGEDNELCAYISYATEGGANSFVTRIDKFKVDYPNKTLVFIETIYQALDSSDYRSVGTTNNNNLFYYEKGKNFTFIKGMYVTGIDKVKNITSLSTIREISVPYVNCSILSPFIRNIRSENSVLTNTIRKVKLPNISLSNTTRRLNALTLKNLSTERSSVIQSKGILNSYRHITNLDYNTCHSRRLVVKSNKSLIKLNRNVRAKKVSLYPTRRRLSTQEDIIIKIPTIKKVVVNDYNRYPNLTRTVVTSSNTLTDTLRRSIEDYSYNHSTLRQVLDTHLITIKVPSIRKVTLNKILVNEIRRLTGNLTLTELSTKRRLYIIREESALYNVNIRLTGIATF